MKNYKIKKIIPNAMLQFYDVGFSEHDLDRFCLLLFKYVVCVFLLDRKLFQLLLGMI